MGWKSKANYESHKLVWKFQIIKSKWSDAC